MVAYLSNDSLTKSNITLSSLNDDTFGLYCYVYYDKFCWGCLKLVFKDNKEGTICDMGLIQ